MSEIGLLGGRGRFVVGLSLTETGRVDTETGAAAGRHAVTIIETMAKKRTDFIKKYPKGLFLNCKKLLAADFKKTVL
jgi:hypothetical protein